MADHMDEVDVVIVGTNIAHSVLASALVWQGTSVLHVDCNEYYGDSTPTFSISQLREWNDKANGSLYSNLNFEMQEEQFKQYPNYEHKHFSIDLHPKVLFAESEMLALLIKSRVHQYTEFLPLSNYYTFCRETESFSKLKTTKNEIFIDESLPLLTKRNLMKFLKIVVNWEEEGEKWERYRDAPLIDFLREKFKLSDTQISEIVYTLGLAFEKSISTQMAIERIRKCLTSYEVYGPFPTLFSKYGGVGELAQGFCRSAAVGGCTYKLKTRITEYNASKKEITFQDGTKTKFTKKIVHSPTQESCLLNGRDHSTDQLFHRLIAVIKKDFSQQWFKAGESAAVLVFPPGVLEEANKKNENSVQVVLYGSSSELCARGTTLVYISSIDSQDCLVAGLEQFLESSSALEEDVILKQTYSQKTSIPFSITDGFDFETAIKLGDKSDVILTPLPSPDASYEDGSLGVAKGVYKKLLGQFDDFFAIDLEEEAAEDEESRKYSNI
ncbi:hypothetical protein ACO0QE_003854 [Hanseniaspora vineae]